MLLMVEHPYDAGMMVSTGEPSTPDGVSAEVAFYDPTPARRKARWVALAFAAAFAIFGIGGTFAVSIAHGSGTGFGDGRLVASCHTPGGPYYPPDLPAAQRNCPNGSEGRAAAPDTAPLRDAWDVLRLTVSVAGLAFLLWGWIQIFEVTGTI